MCSRKIVCLEEVDSTQDEAVRINLQPGEACYSSKQRGGRGRRGNEWNGSGGLALTVVLSQLSEHFPIALAATIAATLNNIIPNHKIGIKWPNDLFVNGKKLAGILIEQKNELYYVGVGLNVKQSPLKHSTCLKDCGADIEIDPVATSLFDSTLIASELTEEQAVTAWRRRDILRGTWQKIQSGSNVVEGLVLDIDPCNNLILQSSDSIVYLPAHAATILTCL